MVGEADLDAGAATVALGDAADDGPDVAAGDCVTDAGAGEAEPDLLMEAVIEGVREMLAVTLAVDVVEEVGDTLAPVLKDAVGVTVDDGVSDGVAEGVGVCVTAAGFTAQGEPM
jgi:hypothetical protein